MLDLYVHAHARWPNNAQIGLTVVVIVVVVVAVIVDLLRRNCCFFKKCDRQTNTDTHTHTGVVIELLHNFECPEYLVPIS